MSKMSEMDMLVQEVADMADANTPVEEAIDAVVLTNDLTAGEHRNLIHFVHNYYRGVES